ncbi:UV excision repair protein RAD23 homolog B [Myripristis murdjan]|uniref:UV excision repair protein RAD23 homolog B n=1 Tax=Myripristis murdjan TaxID=586833 RepID=UPI001175E33E|nr:UV excision repair protein RAD23 homolog B-like [Myripristis murdjan]
MSGHPRPGRVPAVPTGGASGPASAGSSPSAEDGTRLNSLRNQPEHHVMRQLMEQSASLFPGPLQTICRENPKSSAGHK